MGFVTAVKNGVKELFPAYFTLVMATGITSIGANLSKFSAVSNALFWVNNAFYGILIIFLLARLLFYSKEFAHDFTAFKKSPGFLSVVAATCILGTQYAQLKHNYLPASILFWFGVGLWLLLTYAFFITITTKSDKPSLQNGINGIWLLVVVSTQSIVVLGTTISGHLPLAPEPVLFFTLSAFLVGTLLYIQLITIIFYRLIFVPFTPQEMTPTYWINLGAASITTLAGATLMQNLSSTPGLSSFNPFVQGISLLTWATASWWLPYLIFLELWKYLVKKAALSYTPKFWSTVFCLGMYTVATQKLSGAIGVPFLKTIPQVFIYITLSMWVLVLLGMLISIIKTLSSRKTKGLD